MACKPVYETARLALRLAAPSFAPALAGYYRRNRAFFSAFDPEREEDFFTEAAQRASLEKDAALAAEDRGYRFYLFRKEEPETIMGMVGLNNLVRGAFQSCFLAYKIDRTLWGRGYGAEAVEATADWAFRVLGLHRVEANIMPRNLASRKAAAKAGFEEEGLARRYLKINGVWEDHLHMVRRNDEEDL